MAQVSNEDLVRKAIITTETLANAGRLTDAQSSRFLDYVFDESKLKDNARIVRFRNDNMEIDKIGVGNRVAVPKAEATDPQVRMGVTTSKILLNTSEIMVPFEISDTFREVNIEGDNIEDTIVRLMATRLSTNIEELLIGGNKLGHGVPQSDVIPGGSSNYVKDTFLALQDGWQKLSDGANVVDAQGVNIGLSVYAKAVRAMPTKFRRNMSQLRFFESPDLRHMYLEKLSTRATSLGDSAAAGGESNPFGIPSVQIPLWPMEPLVTEHVTLNGTTPVQLKNSNISDVVVFAENLGKVPQTPYVLDTDYSVNTATGVITRIGGAISDGAVVKVTYRALPQLLLTHMDNFIVAIGRDIRIERDRDIFKGVNQYAITAKVGVQFEELSAIVKVKNIGMTL